MGYDAKLHHAVIEDELELRAGAKVLNRDGNDIAAQLDVLDTIASADLTKIDGITDGTVVASKAVVVDANKDAGDFRNLDCVNLDAGASGTAGSIDVFPGTASRGKYTLAVTDQTGNTTVTHQIGAMGQATTINLADPGAAAAYHVLSTAQVTLAEADVLDGVTPGTLAASKAVVVDASSHVDALKTTALYLGASGAAVQVTATAAQLNALAGASAGIAAVLAGGLGGSASFAKTSAATTTLIAAHGTKDRAVLVVVVVDETYDVGTGTLPTVKIGEDDTIEKCMAATVLDTEAAGTVLVFAFTNTATKKIIVTTTAAVGNATGGCTITAIAIPTT